MQYCICGFYATNISERLICPYCRISLKELGEPGHITQSVQVDQYAIASSEPQHWDWIPDEIDPERML